MGACASAEEPCDDKDAPIHVPPMQQYSSSQTNPRALKEVPKNSKSIDRSAVAAPKRIALRIVPPGFEIGFAVNDSLAQLRETIATKMGLDASAARLLQLCANGKTMDRLESSPKDYGLSNVAATESTLPLSVCRWPLPILLSTFISLEHF